MRGNALCAGRAGWEMAVACRRRAVPGLGRCLPDRREATGARRRKVGPVTRTARGVTAAGPNAPMRRMRAVFGPFPGQPRDPRTARWRRALLRDLVARQSALLRRRTVLRQRAMWRRRAVLRHHPARICGGRRIASGRREPGNERVTGPRRRPCGLADGRLADVVSDEARERRLAGRGVVRYRTPKSVAGTFGGTRRCGPRDRRPRHRPPWSPAPRRRRRRAPALVASLCMRRANGLRQAGAGLARPWIRRTHPRRVSPPRCRVGRQGSRYPWYARNVRLTSHGSVVGGRSPLPRSWHRIPGARDRGVRRPVTLRRARWLALASRSTVSTCALGAPRPRRMVLSPATSWPRRWMGGRGLPMSEVWLPRGCLP